jgi:hypothetical protein
LSVARSVALPENAIRAADEHVFDMLATDKMSVVQEEDAARPNNRLMSTSVLPMYDGHLVRRR